MPIGVALGTRFYRSLTRKRHSPILFSGSYLFSNVVHRSYIIMFSINALCLVAAIIYSVVHLQVKQWPNTMRRWSNANLFFFKWKTNDKQRSITEVGCCGVIPDFFDKEHVIQSVKTMTKKRSMNRRAYLWIFMISMLFYTFQRDEKPMTYLYTQYKFNWDTETYSTFKTFQSSAYVIIMLTGIPLMSKVLGFRDTVSRLVNYLQSTTMITNEKSLDRITRAREEERVRRFNEIHIFGSRYVYFYRVSEHTWTSRYSNPSL